MFWRDPTSPPSPSIAPSPRLPATVQGEFGEKTGPWQRYLFLWKQKVFFFKQGKKTSRNERKSNLQEKKRWLKNYHHINHDKYHPPKKIQQENRWNNDDGVIRLRVGLDGMTLQLGRPGLFEGHLAVPEVHKNLNIPKHQNGFSYVFEVVDS